MATYKDVGGIAPIMPPEEVARKQQLAKMLMEGGQDTSNMRHWTQALGSVLQTGVGSYLAGDASRGMAAGREQGNKALAQMLMGGDPSAAMANPYVADKAISHRASEVAAARRESAAERLHRMKLEAERADPMRILKMEETRARIEALRNGGGTPKGMPRLPVGHTWVDRTNPDAGVKRLPGYEQTIPGEVAGKVAMMADAKERIAKTRNTFERDWSAEDVAKWAAGNVPLIGDISPLSGDIGIAQRDVRTAIEAALRTMTGAAAPEQEVVRYMQMYMPSPKDSKESAKQKLDGLVNFMDKAERIVMQGRGQVPGMETPTPSVESEEIPLPAAPLSGGLSPGEYIYNPATGKVERR